MPSTGFFGSVCLSTNHHPRPIFIWPLGQHADWELKIPKLLALHAVIERPARALR
jgi:hypothetical protein